METQQQNPDDEPGTLVVSVELPPGSGRLRYRVVVDGNVADVTSDRPLRVQVDPGRRAVQIRGRFGGAESAVLDVEVLPGDTVPLVTGPNELGLSQAVPLGRLPTLFLRRSDNDPGRRTS